jgi:hypothetical protein
MLVVGGDVLGICAKMLARSKTESINKKDLRKYVESIVLAANKGKKK